MKPFKAVLAAIGACLFLSACDNSPIDTPEYAVQNYTCTPEQMTRVELETAQSIKSNTAQPTSKNFAFYRASYLQGVSIMRICTRKIERKT
jgi:PBP1b-binding outer membrane lipoprotein LpoB